MAEDSARFYTRRWLYMQKLKAIIRITNTLGTTECAKSAKCKPYTHHYEECVARVTGKQEAGEDPKEDCIEECMPSTPPKLWHLSHSYLVHRRVTMVRS